MNVFDAIHGRRSIRKYTNKPIPEKLIAELLSAAMAAPSAGNQQPWHFVVIDEREKLDAIPKYHPYSAMLKEAPAAIVVCGDTRLEKFKGFWVQDCSAAVQNLLLAVHAKGLGAVWLSTYPIEERVEKTQELLGIPKEVIPLAIISLGYPAEKKGPAERFDASRIHKNQW